MATRKKTDHINYEERYLDGLEGKIDTVLAKLEENTTISLATKAQAEKTNGRVTELEGDVDKLNREVFNKVKAKDLPPWYRDDKILKIIGAIIGLAAAAIGLDLSGIMN